MVRMPNDLMGGGLFVDEMDSERLLLKERDG